MPGRDHFQTTLGLSLALTLLFACTNDSNSETPLLDRGSCDVLIECAASLAPETRDEYEQAYGENGTCWQSGPSAWAGCRDFCAMTLDALNLVAMANGTSCGTCSSDADCTELGDGFSCVNGLCSGGSDETGTGDGDGAPGDGDGSPGDGDGTPGDGDGDCIPATKGCECASGVCAVGLVCNMNNICADPVCGDGILSRGEECDGNNLNGFDCGDLGFVSGTLACDPVSCLFDTSQCSQSFCGNGVIEAGEQCDLNNLNGFSCVDIGFSGGSLACSPTCSFDTSGCF